jgi:Cu/Ag efflux pump CusA
MIGGERKEFQVLGDPRRLAQYGVTLQELAKAVAAANAAAGGGVLERRHEEYLIRGRARIHSVEDLARAVVTVRRGVPVLISHVAEVRIGAAHKRGDGSFNGRPAVVATIQKQPQGNTLEITIEHTLGTTPEVVSTTRRTGRAEQDEHAAGVNTSEIEVVLRPSARPHAAVLAEVRENLGRIPALDLEVGQPISHRIDHLLSGTRAQIAVKVFGADLATLRAKAAEVRDAMARVPGIVDLVVEPQVGVPQIQIVLDRRAAAPFGVRAEDLAETVETAFSGHVVSQVLEEHRSFDVLVRLDESARLSIDTLRSTLIDTPTGTRVPIAQVAEVRLDQGPNTINRENVQRRIVIQANVAGRDLGSVIADVRSAVTARVGLPSGYWVQYGGQFESQERAARQITVFSLAAVAGIFLLLYVALNSARLAALIMANLPLALIGGVVMVFLSGGYAVHRVADWLHRAVRHGDPERHHADHALPAPAGRRGREPSRCGHPRIARTPEPDPHDRAGHRDRAGPAGSRRRRARQGNPAADGAGDPRWHRDVNGAEHGRHTGPVSSLRRGGGWPGSQYYHAAARGGDRH